MSYDFLFELGTEELPPVALSTLSKALEDGVKQRFLQAKIGYQVITSYATPRRLAFWVESMDESTPIEEVINWGPPAKIAFDAEGQPTKAATAFAAKNKIHVDDLKVQNDGKTDKLVAHVSEGGQNVKDLLVDIVCDSLNQLPINKRMRWGSSRTEFVRPVKWAVMLLNEEILPATIMGLSTGNLTRGHRFHADQEITISKPSQYQSILLEKGKVVASFADRQNIIKQKVKQEAKKIGGNAVISDDLLNEVTALVEWPVPLAGKFDPSFLSVPSEALISSMKEHQKYFHVTDDQNQLLPYFVTVSNIESNDPSQVIDGNERVIRPRLADAAFFFDTDKKTTLEARREKLKNVVFQSKLGTVYDKTVRLTQLSQFICEQINIDGEHAIRASQLSKSDLISNMVVEFSDMQGIAGYHYALNDNEHKNVASALAEQYLPKFSGDKLPETNAGTVLALADRIDTITGIFGIGLIPSGSKDPFALRRASLGSLRLIVEKNLHLDLKELIVFAAGLHTALPKADNVVDDVLKYMIERFKSWYTDAGIAPEVFQAVSAKRLSKPLDINNRVYAVKHFYSMPEAKALAAANKRVANILAKQTQDINKTVDDTLFDSEAERNLHKHICDIQTQIAPLIVASEYTKILSALAQLRENIDTFFDDVMVLTDDLALRANRLALLKQLQALFLHVADISYLDVKK